MDTKLWIIIPCYNEQEVLPLTAPIFLSELEKMISLGKISDQSRILFVNDGSSDRTWEIIKELAAGDSHFIGISQSRNRGHQNAVLAGLIEAKDRADITISIDCDGQDDPTAMEKMVDEYHDGCEIVYGVRSSRKTDSFFKRCTAQSFYKLMNLMGAETVYNHADYRLVSARVLREFADFEEVNLFLRGMFPLVGFKSTSVYYERAERVAGNSHYPLSKMLALAFNGITSLSVKPLSMITGFGAFLSFISFLGLLAALICGACAKPFSGTGLIITVLCFLSGLQLLAIGIVGEYTGRTYMEAKHRPRYIISERTFDEE